MPRRHRPATPRPRSSSASRSSASAGRRRGPRSSRRCRTVATSGRRARRSYRRGPRSRSLACSSSTSTTSSTTTSRPTSRPTSTPSPPATARRRRWLQSFYFGDDTLPGLKRLVEENLDEIDAAAINTFPIGRDADGEEVVVKPGKYGPYVKRGEDTASVPEDLTPDELTLDKALELLAAPKSDEPIGELDGLPVFAKNGRYGPYVQWGTADAPPPRLRQAEDVEPLQDDGPRADHVGRGRVAAPLLPRTLGTDPADGEPIVAANGRYGPYVQKGRGLLKPGQRGAPLHGDAGGGAADLLPAEGLPARRPEHGGQGPPARVRH